MLKQTYKPVFVLALTIFLSVFSVKACPPPVTIEVNCPGGDCDITIVTGDNNEISQEGKKGPIGEVVDDILDFLSGIFKKKGGGDDGGDDGGGDGGDGGDGGSGEGGGTETPPVSGGGGEGSEEEAESTAFEQKLFEITDYFVAAKITAEGIVLNYPPDTDSCQTGFTMSYNIDIPVPQKWLKKYKISGKRKLKAGKYTTNNKGRLLLPFIKV